MVKGLLVVATAGAVGFAVTKVVFTLLLPLLFIALKLAFFCVIAYLVLRMVKPDLAQDLKERCCGSK